MSTFLVIQSYNKSGNICFFFFKCGWFCFICHFGNGRSSQEQCIVGCSNSCSVLWLHTVIFGKCCIGYFYGIPCQQKLHILCTVYILHTEKIVYQLWSYAIPTHSHTAIQSQALSSLYCLLLVVHCITHDAPKRTWSSNCAYGMWYIKFKMHIRSVGQNLSKNKPFLGSIPHTTLTLLKIKTFQGSWVTILFFNN